MTDKEINEAVAKKLGWYHKSEEETLWTGGLWYRDQERQGMNGLPNYCHDIAAAWEIIKTLDNYSVKVMRAGPTTEWFCLIFSWKKYSDIYKRQDEIETKAETAPKAICLAFLKMGEK